MASSSTATECPVCKQEYTTPKLLPCAHVICAPCLLSWLPKDARKSCPVCRMALVSSPDLENSDVIVDQLPDDYGTLAILQSHKILQSAHVCDVCDDDNAETTSFCVACSMKLCQRCSQFHTKFHGTKHHVTLPFRELAVEPLAVSRHVTCPEHCDRPMELYCPAHQKVMCALCVALHAGCGVEKMMVEEVAERERQQLKTQAARLMDLGSAMNNKINHLEQQLHHGKHDFIAASLTIKEQFLEFQQALDKRRQELLDLVHNEREKFLAAATSELAPLKDLQPLLVCHGQAADRLACNAPAAHLLTMLSHLQPRLEELESKSAEEKPLPPLRRTDPRDASDERTKSRRAGSFGGVSLMPSPSEAEVTTTTPPPTFLSRFEHGEVLNQDGEVLNQQTTSAEVKHSAADLVLDVKLVDTLKHAIASIAFSPGVSGDDADATIAPFCQDGPGADTTMESSVKGKHDAGPATEHRWTKNDPPTKDDDLAAEDGTVSEDPARKNTSTALGLACPPPVDDTSTALALACPPPVDDTSTALALACPPPVDDVRDTTGDSLHLMSSSVPSSFRLPRDAFSAVDRVKVTFDDTVIVSSDQLSRRGRLAAVSGFLSSFLTKHLDNTTPSDGSSSTRSPSASELPSSTNKGNPDIAKTGNRANDSSPTTTHAEDASASEQGDNSKFLCDDRQDPVRPQTLNLGHSRGKRVRGTGAEAERQRLEMSYEASRDNWMNDSLEAVQHRRRSKFSSDIPSSNPVDPGAAVQVGLVKDGDQGEGVALENRGYAVLSSPTSHAGQLVDMGSRVMRGRDWSRFHGNIDGGAGRVGHVLTKGKGEHHVFGKGWVLVHWNATGRRRWHRMGAEGCFDLTLL